MYEGHQLRRQISKRTKSAWEKRKTIRPQCSGRGETVPGGCKTSEDGSEATVFREAEWGADRTGRFVCYYTDGRLEDHGGSTTSNAGEDLAQRSMAGMSLPHTRALEEWRTVRRELGFEVTKVTFTAAGPT